MSLRRHYPALAAVCSSEATAQFSRMLKQGFQLNTERPDATLADYRVAPIAWLVDCSSGLLFSASLAGRDQLQHVSQDAAQMGHRAVVSGLSAIARRLGTEQQDFSAEDRHQLAAALWMYVAGTSSFARILPAASEQNGLDAIVLMRTSPYGGGVDLRPLMAMRAINRDPKGSTPTLLALANQVLATDKKAKTGWYRSG